MGGLPPVLLPNELCLKTNVNACNAGYSSVYKTHFLKSPHNPHHSSNVAFYPHENV